MKRLFYIASAALLLLGIMIFAGCTGGGQDIVINLYTPSATEINIPVPTLVPGSSPTPTPEPTLAPDDPNYSAEPTPEGTPIVPDYSVLDDAALIGNSTFEGLYRFGVITHGTFFTKVGLNVLTVHTASTEHGTVPIIDELWNGHYNKVLLMFGENELGWPSPSSYIQKYSELLDAVWKRQPQAEIYIVAMPPVTESYSSWELMGVSNVNIQNFNAMMKDLAERRGCHYIDVPKELMTYNGALPDDASSDGLHLNLKYSRYWADHICLSVMGVYD